MQAPRQPPDPRINHLQALRGTESGGGGEAHSDCTATEKCQPDRASEDGFRAFASQGLKITTGKWSPVLLSNNSARTNVK